MPNSARRTADRPEPAIRIDIGAIDVRAAAPPPLAPRTRRPPALTLAQYLRAGGRRA